jgi:hypothetical protein
VVWSAVLFARYSVTELLVANISTVLTLITYGAASMAVLVCLRQVAWRTRQGGLAKLITGQMGISLAAWAFLMIGLAYESYSIHTGFRASQSELTQIFIFAGIILALVLMLTSYVLALIIFFRLKVILKKVGKLAPQPAGDPKGSNDPYDFM